MECFLLLFTIDSWVDWLLYSFLLFKQSCAIQWWADSTQWMLCILTRNLTIFRSLHSISDRRIDEWLEFSLRREIVLYKIKVLTFDKASTAYNTLSMLLNSICVFVLRVQVIHEVVVSALFEAVVIIDSMSWWVLTRPIMLRGIKCFLSLWLFAFLAVRGLAWSKCGLFILNTLLLAVEGGVGKLSEHGIDEVAVFVTLIQTNLIKRCDWLRCWRDWVLVRMRHSNCWLGFRWFYC